MIGFSNQNRSRSARVVAAMLLFATIAIVAACGKRGAPVPPSERVRQRADLSAFQRGSEVLLSWKMPTRNAGRSSIQNISRVDIYRLAEPVTSPEQITEAEFSNRSTVIGMVPVTNADFAGQTMTYRDRLQFSTQSVRLRYAVRLVNASGQKASFSNLVTVQPGGRVSAAPTELKAVVTQDAIKLEWTKPDANLDGTTPANIIGYNVYRSSSEKEPARLLTQKPITTEEFDDEFFEFDKHYFYFVRAVSLGTEAEPIESGETNIVEVKPVDTFPPSAPEALTVAAVPGTISIFFALNPEKDIKGYSIYRSDDPSKPLSEWELLTPEPIIANSFQDRNIRSGIGYSYFVRAVDTKGNVSDPSTVVTEIAP